jgi:hypothetical protein
LEGTGRGRKAKSEERKWEERTISKRKKNGKRKCWGGENKEVQKRRIVEEEEKMGSGRTDRNY